MFNNTIHYLLGLVNSHLGKVGYLAKREVTMDDFVVVTAVNGLLCVNHTLLLKIGRRNELVLALLIGRAYQYELTKAWNIANNRCFLYAIAVLTLKLMRDEFGISCHNFYNSLVHEALIAFVGLDLLLEKFGNVS